VIDATLTQPMLAENRVRCIQGCFDPLDVMRASCSVEATSDVTFEHGVQKAVVL
jgi:hypothetical protein